MRCIDVQTARVSTPPRFTLGSAADALWPGKFVCHDTRAKKDATGQSARVRLNASIIRRTESAAFVVCFPFGIR